MEKHREVHASLDKHLGEQLLGEVRQEEMGSESEQRPGMGKK